VAVETKDLAFGVHPYDLSYSWISWEIPTAPGLKAGLKTQLTAIFVFFWAVSVESLVGCGGSPGSFYELARNLSTRANS